MKPTRSLVHPLQSAEQMNLHDVLEQYFGVEMARASYHCSVSKKDLETIHSAIIALYSEGLSRPEISRLGISKPPYP